MRIFSFSFLTDYRKSAIILIQNHHGNSLFDDACLLGCNGFNSIPQNRRMVKTDGCDHRKNRHRQHRGVQPSAKPRLHNAVIHIFPGENEQAHEKQNLKISERLSRAVSVRQQSLHLFPRLYELSIRTHLKVDAEPLVHMHQMR